MRIPIEDDYNSGTKIIIAECEKESIPANLFNSEVTIVDATYNEATEDDYSKKYIEYYEQEVDADEAVDDNIFGKILVISRLANVNGALISSAKINLYILNGLSPKLIETKYSNEDGVVLFENLKSGSYRIIAIVDRKYFEKPTYLEWNEVTLNNEVQEAKIIVINNIKNNFKK